MSLQTATIVKNLVRELDRSITGIANEVNTLHRKISDHSLEQQNQRDLEASISEIERAIKQIKNQYDDHVAEDLKNLIKQLEASVRIRPTL